MLEFWPDYGSGPLWSAGKPVELNALHLEPELVRDVAAWNASYAEDKIPVDGPGDAAWLASGRDLLLQLRSALGSDYQVVVTEPWWDQEPSDN